MEKKSWGKQQASKNFEKALKTTFGIKENFNFNNNQYIEKL